MSNTILTSSIIAKESLRLLENNLVFARGAARKYKQEFDGEYKTGDTINVKKAARYTVRSGATLSVQDHVEQSVPITLDSQKGVDVEFTSKEMALSLDDFSEHVLKPQIAALANQIDYEGLVKAYQATANAVGTPGTLPSAIKTYALAGAKMDNGSCPMDDNRNIVLSPLSQVEIIDATKGLFQSSEQIKKQYERGRMGTAAGFDWAMSQNVPTHTVGPLGGSPLVKGASQTGSTLETDGWTAAAASRLKKGDIFEIAGVYGVNPQTRLSTGQLQQFVVTADVSSDGSGNASIPIYPAIVTSGARQTVTASPADNQGLTILGAANAVSPTNLAYHKEAMTLVTVDLPIPKNMEMASRASSKQAGLSIRFVRGFDITNDKFVSRLDVLYGWGVLYPEWMCRIQG